MEKKTYVSQRKYTTKDGTVKVCANTSSYTPKPKEGKPKQVRKKKEDSINGIVVDLKTLKKDDLIKVKKYVEDLKNAVAVVE
jgi:hypothetical protein